MQLPMFFVENQSAILFYVALILFIVIFRKKLDWQAFGIGLYRTKVGLNLMKKWGERHRGLVQLLGVIGIGAGFVGMALIMGVMIKGFFDLFVNPAAPPVVSPVIPGFSIWGHDLKVPLITGWLALFVVIVIHEFSHGVVSIAHNIKVKSSGLLVFGPLGGAFVEPEEEQLKKQRPDVQYAMFAAGPWSNMISGLVVMLLLTFVATPLYGAMTTPGGVELVGVSDDHPAAAAGLREGMVVTSINGQAVSVYEEMNAAFSDIEPGDEIDVGTTEGQYAVTTIENPDQEGSAFIGVTLQNVRNPKRSEMWYSWILTGLEKTRVFLNWVFILSLGLGLANLLPIGPIDGGRMLQTACRQLTGSEKRGDWWWKRISLVTLVLIVTLLIFPLIRGITG